MKKIIYGLLIVTLGLFAFGNLAHAASLNDLFNFNSDGTGALASSFPNSFQLQNSVVPPGSDNLNHSSSFINKFLGIFIHS